MSTEHVDDLLASVELANISAAFFADVLLGGLEAARPEWEERDDVVNVLGPDQGIPRLALTVQREDRIYRLELNARFSIAVLEDGAGR